MHTVTVDCGPHGSVSCRFKTLEAAIEGAALLSKALNCGYTRAKDGVLWIWADTAENRKTGILADITR